MSNSQRKSFSDVLAWLGHASTGGRLRSEPRLSVRAPVRLVAPLDPAERAVELFDAETRDITPGGVCIVAPWRPKPGQLCKVELPGGVHSVMTTLRCQVSYTVPEENGNHRTGLTFLAAA
jgi:hypothetical protein